MTRLSPSLSIPEDPAFLSWRDQISSLKIAIITAQFNAPITHALEAGAMEYLQAYVHVTPLSAPGAVELPLIAQQALKSGFDAVICLGCVIRGDTDHYDYVCQMVAQGVMSVSLTREKPVIFGLLTCDTEAQALARTLDDLNDVEASLLAKLKGLAPVGNKGRESAQAVLETLYTLHGLSEIVYQ
jgi:6,7-dimethyl-8-ribityllumazine synthase